MEELLYQPKDAWVGDLIPYYDDGMFYAFYLHDPRKNPKEYAEETTWHLVTTKDFVNLEYKGEAIKRGGEKDPNYNIYTGSVIKDRDGIYHAFYTAYNSRVMINGKSIQSVMQATGPDPEHLETVEDFIFTADGELYEEFDWRDPYVFWNEEENCYDMLLAARIKGSGERRGGCVALCRSRDLMHWSYEKPFYAPGMYITMECPEVFKMGSYWYLVFSTFSDRFATHYRISRNLNGEWEIPEEDLFDTRANYAIKTASDGEKRYAFGWIASKYGNRDFGPWDWGGTMVFHELIQDQATGRLKVKMIQGIQDSFPNEEKDLLIKSYQGEIRQEQDGICLAGRTLGAVMYPLSSECFLAEFDLEIRKASEFGILVHVDEMMEKGYFLRMDPQKGTAAWDMWPRSEKGFYQWQIKGDVPCQIETERKIPHNDIYHIQVLKYKDICIVYINEETALSWRMYDHKGENIGVYVIQGEVKVKGFHLLKR